MNLNKESAVRAYCLLGLASVVSLMAGCSESATLQDITVNTDPQGAACDVYRNSVIIATIDSTPDVIQVGLDSGALQIYCKKAGYKPTTGTVAAKASYKNFSKSLERGLGALFNEGNATGTNAYRETVTIQMGGHQ
jgi:hypothetical protein